MPLDRLSTFIKDVAVIENVSLRVEPAFGIDLYLEPLLLDHSGQRRYHCLSLVRLVHELDSRPNVARRFSGHPFYFRTFGISFRLSRLRHQFQPPVALGQLLQGLTARRVADEQSQLLHTRQPLRDALQP